MTVLPFGGAADIRYSAVVRNVARLYNLAKQDVAGYARSFVGLAGTSAAIATAMALISLLARKNMA